MRATKYNARTSRIVIDALKRGHSIRAAAAFAGVTHPTVADWIRTRPMFAAAVDKAKASYLDKLAKKVTDAAEHDPRLAHAILKAKDPEGWAEATRHEVSGPGGAPVPITIDLRWPDGTTPPSQMP